MKKHELLKFGDSIIRILEFRQDKVLIINCVNRRMPAWIENTALDSYEVCSDDELMAITDIAIQDVNTLCSEQRKIMYDRYTIIAPILPFIADDKMRSMVMKAVSEERAVSRQTIRNHLYLYLAFMDIAVLAPKLKVVDTELTSDEKNMRWALNKFFYTKNKNTLTTAYTMMLKEKYCNSSGELYEDYPSFYQFRYFYRKTRKMQNYYISRNGLTNYQRNNRPLTGNGVQEFAPAVGTGMLDATVCDIYLVNDAGNLVGRPILTACIDAYSGLCCGYALSWEGGVYSLRGLLLNVITDKTEWCKQFGISLLDGAWDCDMLPATLVTDMGSEYKSENFEQIAELGVTVVNLPSYRPELKGMVEKFFDLIQETYKKYLKGKGVIEPDYQERGVRDYRKDACLTIQDFEAIILHCIIYYNAQRVIERFPYTKAMIADDIKPYASAIWNWGKKQMGANLIAVTERELILTLLPRTKGKFSRRGLSVNKLRYHCQGFTERYLNGGTVTVAYNPEDVSVVWLLENGVYTEFALIESRFQGKDLLQVEEIRTEQKSIVKASEKDNLQAQIHLAHHIEAIAHSAEKGIDVRLKDIRTTRKQEQNKHHRDYMREGMNHD